MDRDRFNIEKVPRDILRAYMTKAGDLFMILLCPVQGPCASRFYFAPNLALHLNGDIINIHPFTEIFNLIHQVDLNMLFICYII